MKLAIDASNIARGGGVTHLEGILSEVTPAEHGFDVVSLWGGRALLERIANQPWLEKRHSPLLDASLAHRLWWLERELRPALRRANDTLLFCPGGVTYPTSVPAVTMSQNLIPFDDDTLRLYPATSSMRARLLLLRALQWSSFRRAAGVIFLTDAARDAVLGDRRRIAGRTAVIAHGIDESLRRPPQPAVRIEDCSAARPFRLLYVSIIDLYKHQWTVAEAVARLRREGLPLTLDLVGPAYPPALERLQRVLRRVDPTEAVIRYHGGVAAARLGDVYRAADAFVFASTCETFGIILLEAMASGLPIACSDHPVMREILADAGPYFDPRSVESVAATLRSFVQHASRRERCAARAFERAQAYSWERCARETFDFLAQVARQSGVRNQ